MADERCKHCNGSGMVFDSVYPECKTRRCPNGCPMLTDDKTIETCKNVYNNILNFRGFKRDDVL